MSAKGTPYLRRLGCALHPARPSISPPQADGLWPSRAQGRLATKQQQPMRCLVISVRPAHQPVLAWLAKAGHQREQALRGRSSRRGSRANANERRASNDTNTNGWRSLGMGGGSTAITCANAVSSL
ncbi:hypothetical protein PCL_04548 [Purpureocillium lilacinum]|uniref:Uncharacterized protein n=1 Tax=Purpureocillium lilacinum TaxID=33203 RepID=A0A2U3DXS4_PURLI|nr:hypothetical protein PCL_04548 [Purpureocillium lilacinum]